ncbi:ATPase [Sulfurimonas sp. CVO]|uniref:ATP-binding protein n=1 Tax=Sulfurimonas sp. CVO TaxID=2283483 RepID=UPI00132EA6B6|nr:ATP-binding protein [Sulfurimonas sp. CVO]QHG91961.1 ATPase [Sulfurimonas sp. CVO]
MKITIASGKGGTGKTTISTNLSSYLAKEADVVLADLDVEEPNSKLFIEGNLIFEKACDKMVPQWKKDECTLCGNCEEVCRFNAVIKVGDEILVFPELCHSCYACSELCPTESLPMIPQKIGELKHFKTENLDFVEGRLDIGEEQAVPLISQVIEYIDEKFSQDTIKLFDAPPGTSCPVIEASRGSDFVILVTESTPFGLNDLKLAVETMRVLCQKFGVVINRHGIGDNGVEEYCNAEGIPIIAKIPNDRRVAELYSKGELIYPKIQEFETALKQIAEFVGGVK